MFNNEIRECEHVEEILGIEYFNALCNKWLDFVKDYFLGT